MSIHKGVYERSVSLSVSVMASRSPTSPDAEKKNVHFAEGEDLVNVKTYVPSYDDLDALRKVFLHEVPLKAGNNSSNTEDPEDDRDVEDCGEVRKSFKRLKGSSTRLTKSFRIVQMISRENDHLSAMYDNLETDELEKLLKDHNICLCDTRLNGRTINGFIIVNNLAYDKAIFVRHTFDDWQTVSEIPAYYISSFDNGRKDKFGFNLTFPVDKSELAFALQYCVNGKEYWDNNHGNNYKVVDFM